jgi:hypothetical protein
MRINRILWFGEHDNIELNTMSHINQCFNLDWWGNRHHNNLVWQHHYNWGISLPPTIITLRRHIQVRKLRHRFLKEITLGLLIWRQKSAGVNKVVCIHCDHINWTVGIFRTSGCGVGHGSNPINGDKIYRHHCPLCIRDWLDPYIIYNCS